MIVRLSLTSTDGHGQITTGSNISTSLARLAVAQMKEKMSETSATPGYPKAEGEFSTGNIWSRSTTKEEIS